MANRNKSRQAPKDNAKPAVHTSSPVVQKKNIFLSNATQLLDKLLENRPDSVASRNAYT